MPKLKRARHELFSQKTATGVPQSEAYAMIFGASKSVVYNASRLRARKEVRERIAELVSERENQERHAAGDGMSAGDVIKRLAHEAYNGENAAARVRALELLGKANGIEGFNTHNVRHLRNPSEMSTAELKAILEQARAQGYVQALAEAAPKQIESGEVIDV